MPESKSVFSSKTIWAIVAMIVIVAADPVTKAILGSEWINANIGEAGKSLLVGLVGAFAAWGRTQSVQPLHLLGGPK